MILKDEIVLEFATDLNAVIVEHKYFDCVRVLINTKTDYYDKIDFPLICSDCKVKMTSFCILK